MTLRELEEKINKIEELEETIILDDYGYYEGKKYTRDDLPKISELKEYYERNKKKLLSKGITIEDCSRMIAFCIEAEEGVLSGQSYEYEGRSLTRANLKEIRDLKKHYESLKIRLEHNIKPGIKVFRLYGNDL